MPNQYPPCGHPTPTGRHVCDQCRHDRELSRERERYPKRREYIKAYGVRRRRDSGALPLDEHRAQQARRRAERETVKAAAREQRAASARTSKWRDPSFLREYQRKYRQAHPDYVRRMHVRHLTNTMKLGGERIDIRSLPSELQPVARLIRETRQLIDQQRKGTNRE